MGDRRMTVMLLTAVVAFIGVLPSIGFCDDQQASTKFYESCIIQEIAGCQNKVSLLNSRSENLQEYARVELQKAAFLADQKESLIQELLERQIARKGHSVQVYINSRFYEKTDNRDSEEALLRPKEAAR